MYSFLVPQHHVFFSLFTTSYFHVCSSFVVLPEIVYFSSLSSLLILLYSVPVPPCIIYFYSSSALLDSRDVFLAVLPKIVCFLPHSCPSYLRVLLPSVAQHHVFLFLFVLSDSRVFFLSVPPNIVDGKTSGDVMVQEGANITLECSATGTPTPTITWRREDHLKINLNKTYRGEASYSRQYAGKLKNCVGLELPCITLSCPP